MFCQEGKVGSEASFKLVTVEYQLKAPQISAEPLLVFELFMTLPVSEGLCR